MYLCQIIDIYLSIILKLQIEQVQQTNSKLHFNFHSLPLFLNGWIRGKMAHSFDTRGNADEAYESAIHLEYFVGLSVRAQH